jgi:hypothetical protein
MKRIALPIVAAAVAGTGLAVTPIAAAQPPAPECGPDQATALQMVLDTKPLDPMTDEPWDGAPVASNYNPCADLSTILVSIRGGTGSSPVHALMFHRGQYQGTATYKAYGFTTLDAARSTGDTVVLDYKTPGDVSSVRYQWQGHVATLDPMPPV